MRVKLSSATIIFNENEFRATDNEQKTYIRVSMTKNKFKHEIKQFLKNYKKQNFPADFYWILQSKYSITHFFETERGSHKIRLTQYRTSEEQSQKTELCFSIYDLKILASTLSKTAVTLPPSFAYKAWRQSQKPLYKRRQH